MRYFFLCLLCLSVSFSFSGERALAADGLPEGFVIESVVDDLFLPTALAFASDGRAFIAQKDGSVRVLGADGVLQDVPFIDMNNSGNLEARVNAAEDRGLIGIALDPNFAENGFVYLAYTYDVDPSRPGGYEIVNSRPGCENFAWGRTPLEGEGSTVDCTSIPAKTARVARVQESGGVADMSTFEVILGKVGGTPSAPSCEDYPGTDDCIASDSGSHSIGGIRFGADGYLYVATGDGAGFFSVEQQAFRAQDLDHLSGKILRVNPDGSAVSTNPFYTSPDDNRSKVWAYGLRNPYRFNFIPGTNTILGGNVGWYQFEEVNKIEPGKNYGWPCFEGALSASNGYQNLPECQEQISSGVDSYGESFEIPYLSYAHDADGNGAVTSGAFATSAFYPESIRGKFIFGDYVFGELQYFDPTAEGPIQSSDVTVLAKSGEIVPVEFVTSPDGIVYYLNIFPGSLKRIVYSADNPIPVIEERVAQNKEQTFIFDGTNSQIVGGLELSYFWNFGDGSDAQGPVVEHAYESVGTYEVSLTVIASNGNQDTLTKTIEVLPALYDTDPRIVSTDMEHGPYYVGDPKVITSIIENEEGSGDDPFFVGYHFFNQDGDRILSLVHDGEIIIPEGEQREITIALRLPTVGLYRVEAFTQATDLSRLFDRNTNAFEFEVVSRAPSEETTAPTPPPITKPSAPAVSSVVPVYRFYSEVFGGHFYTTSDVEREATLADSNWNYEGIAYSASPTQESGLVPVYRFYSPQFRGHFYTISATEKAATEADSNWNYEGISYYVYTGQTENTAPVYRFWNPTVMRHFYTSSTVEFQELQDNNPQWNYEGIGWYIED